MLLHIRRALIALAVITVICGFIYPLAETGLAAWWFPHQAGGSITADGSTLIGQHWTGAKWFHGRPDADNPSLSGGTNLGPTSKVLATQVRAAIAAEKKLGVINPPADLVTTSGSGVDPDITPQAALVQVPQVARARGLSQAALRRLVHRKTQGAEWGFLGEPVVNVLQLNEAVARLAQHSRRSVTSRSRGS